jgi:hypothetical protein
LRSFGFGELRIYSLAISPFMVNPSQPVVRVNVPKPLAVRCFQYSGNL